MTDLSTDLPAYPSGPLPPEDDLPLWKELFFRLRDWTWENYQTAYLLGTAALTTAGARIVQADPWSALQLWLGIVVFGTLVEPCINPQNERYGAMLWRGNPERKEVALTFDDGPWPPYTEQLLDILAAEQVPAAFFLIGQQVRKHPEIARRIRDEGHIVGNHTETHCNLLLATPSRSKQEIQSGKEAIETVLDHTPVWFRPPWGFRTGLTISQARQLGQKVALWTYDPRDWQQPHPQVLTRRVVDSCIPGTVVLMHDGNGDRSSTVAALPQIIRELREQGYRFVSLDELERGLTRAG